MKSRPRAFPTEVFLASASVIAVIVCLGGCLAAGRAGEDFAFGVYAALLLSLSLGGGGLIALISALGGRAALRRENERLRRANEELSGEMKNLAEAAERREEFIASFAHELKTPLTAIIGYADMLRSREMTPKNRFTAAGYIFSEGKRLESLSLKLMELIVYGKQGVERRRFDAPYFIREVAAVAVPSLANDGMTLDMRWEPGEVWIEPDLFKTLMINLIDNARKASRRGQTVELFGKNEQEGYAFYVPRPRPRDEEGGPDAHNRAVLYDRQVALARAERGGAGPRALPAHCGAARHRAGVRQRTGQGYHGARAAQGGSGE